MSQEALINRYRPQKWSEVIGQDHILPSFQRSIRDGTSHAFALVGPSGCGKTSLARLAARELGANALSLIEVDGATVTGIDAMRALTESLRNRPFGRDNVKAVLIDEAHRISAQAWDSALKMVEEPPDWLYWFFCTTNGSRIPTTIRTRCVMVEVKAVGPNELLEFLEEIAEEDGCKAPTEVLNLCVREAHGSVRQALSNLAVCYGAETRKDAAKALVSAEELAGEGNAAFRLAQSLVQGSKWKDIQPLFEKLLEQDNESVRHTVRAYLTKVVAGSKDEQAATRAMAVLDHFAEPWNRDDGLTPVVLAVGRSLFAR